MSDAQNPSSDPSSLDGKGWDILVGGRDNPYEAGGKDPFDLDTAAKDAEADAVLGISTSPTLPSQPMPDAAVGVSAGVSVSPMSPSPTGSSIIEITPPGTAPLSPVASPTSTSIIEVAPTGTEAPSPTASGVFLPITDTPSPVPSPAPVVEFVPSTPVSSVPPIPEFVPESTPSVEPFGIPPVMSGIPASPPMGGVPGFTVPYSAPSGMFGSGPAFDDPFGGIAPALPKADEEDLVPDTKLSKMLITDDRVNDLWDDINDTYKLVINDVRGHFNTTEHAIDDLRRARELLLHDIADYDNAEELVVSVKARLRLEEKVRQWSVRRGTWIATYLLLWLILLSMGSVFTNKFAEFAILFVPAWMAATWLPGLFGGLGGVIGALWVLNKHITRTRDFDPIHTMWYVTNPFLGAALGVTTYVLVAGSGWLLTTLGGSGDFTLTPALSLTLNGLCLIVGFNQNVLWSLVDRFIKAVIPQKEEDDTAATDTSSDPGLPPTDSKQGGG
jgi:hypothetical protein